MALEDECVRMTSLPLESRWRLAFLIVGVWFLYGSLCQAHLGHDVCLRLFVKKTGQEQVKAQRTFEDSPLDLSNKYNENWKKTRSTLEGFDRLELSEVEKKIFEQHEVFFVGGLWTDFAVPFTELNIFNHSGMGKFFGEQRVWLDRYGVNHSIIAVAQQKLTFDAIGPIVERIKNCKKDRILIYSHSNGSKIVLDALISLLDRPDLLDRVSWISIQGAFGGTPVADAIVKQPVIHYLLGNIFKILNGSREAVKGLSTEVRSQFLNDNADKIKQVLSHVKSVAFASRKVKGKTVLGGTKQVLDILGVESDGLLPSKSQVLSGQKYVFDKTSEIDHAQSIMNIRGYSWYDNVRMLRSMIALLFEDLH